MGTDQADVIRAWILEHRQAGDRGELAQLAAGDDEYRHPRESGELTQRLQRAGDRAHVGGGV